MRACAHNVLEYFIDIMPDVPFTEDDIIISFAKKVEMATQALALCSQCCPDKTLTENQLLELGESIAANALIGKEKSAILVRINSKINKLEFKRMIFHELMHIYCAKMEIDENHFIDIYGSGTTYNCSPDEEAYDGIIVAGYNVWSEFIAQYFAIKMIDKKSRRFNDIAEFINRLFHEVTIIDLELSKKAFSMICACWLNCLDFKETLASLYESSFSPLSDEPHGAETQEALCDCTDYMYMQMQRDKPWKIDEEFIYLLGFKFSAFRILNSQYLGVI